MNRPGQVDPWWLSRALIPAISAHARRVATKSVILSAVKGLPFCGSGETSRSFAALLLRMALSQARQEVAELFQRSTAQQSGLSERSAAKSKDVCSPLHAQISAASAIRGFGRWNPAASSPPSSTHLRLALDIAVLACALGCFSASAAAQSATPANADQPFTVFLDAAHGGPETGTILAPQLLEKDLVLTVSVQLRSALAARGMRVVTTRESDAAVPQETRAAEANHSGAAACLVLHATASGSGVHIYTSSLGRAPATAGLVPWSSAGASFATDSLKLASAIGAAVESAGIPYTLGRVRMTSMDAMRCPAVAVELAPFHPVRSGSRESPAELADTGYQARLVDALAAALLQWRGEWQSAHAHPPASGAFQ